MVMMALTMITTLATSSVTNKHNSNTIPAVSRQQQWRLGHAALLSPAWPLHPQYHQRGVTGPAGEPWCPNR